MKPLDIAITGIAGRFPKCKNIEDFKNALFEGTNLVTDNHDIWNTEMVETPPHLGILDDYKYFDASFFDISKQAAEIMDPRCRKLLEVVFESIVDAGINPNELRGTKTGVYLALMQTPFMELDVTKSIHKTTYMIVNWISYIFDLRGPSIGIDTGCSSSITAINEAVTAIMLGQCDAAIICSAQAQFLPYDSIEFNSLGVLSRDGRCKTFDTERNGYVKSEAVVSVLLQKKDNSRRIYATIRGVGCNSDGYNNEGILHPSFEGQVELLKSVYQNFEIDPDEVVYVECHGTGTTIGDIVECTSLSTFFKRIGRDKPLYVGSVKTNMGHSEGTGGLVSLIKVLLAIQNKVIPKNLNFQNPAIDIPPITQGVLKVVSEKTIISKGLFAINSFGLGGSNAHLVLEPYAEQQDNCVVSDKTRLVLFSGRSQAAVKFILTKIKEHKDNQEFLSLLNHVFSKSIKNHNYRGFTILNTKTENKTISKCVKKKRPIWFSYSGMGSQWPEMGKDLMKFDVFKRTIKQCAEVVKSYGLELEDIIINGTNETFEDPVNCFSAIVAVSVGLTDLLFSFGIRPIGIIGHSLGEVGCAYADGTLTAEQAILVGYARGLATKNAILIPGLMASVGLSVENCQKILPKDIYIACDNCDSNVTISGPEESVKNFVNMLMEKNIFARIINTGNVAFHSKYIYAAVPQFFNFVKEVIPVPKPRSEKWLSSAVPVQDWGSELCRFSSAEYHCHNFQSRVIFNQVLKMVPLNAILIEVAPRGLLQAIFRRSLDINVSKFYLVEKDNKDNEYFFLSTIGKIYLAGGEPNISNFYKSVLPTGPQTPTLGSLISWDHQDTWRIPKYVPDKFFGKKVKLNMKNEDCNFLSKNGANGFFMSWSIMLVWKNFSEMHGVHFQKLPIEIKNLQFCKLLSKDKYLNEIKINILASGKFEISSHNDVILAGIIKVADKNRKISFNGFSQAKDFYQQVKLSGENFYKILSFNGYPFNEKTRIINEINFRGQTGTIEWKHSWMDVIFSMILICGALENSDIMVPAEISSILINPQYFVENQEISVFYNDISRSVACPFIELKQIKWNLFKHIKTKKEIINLRYHYIPYLNIKNPTDPAEEVISNILQVILENSLECEHLIIAETIDFTKFEMFKKLIINSKEVMSNITIDYHMLDDISPNISARNFNLLILSTLIDDKKIDYLKEIRETFILTDTNKNVDKLANLNFVGIFKRRVDNKTFTLMKKSRNVENCKVVEVKQLQVQNKQYSEVVNNDDQWIIFIQYDHWITSKEIRKLQTQFPQTFFQIVQLEGFTKIFSLKSRFYKTQIEKRLMINVLKNSEWGGYHYSNVETLTPKKVDSCICSFVQGSLKWTEESSYRDRSNEIRVCYSSLDYWDNFYKKSNHTNCLGIDYSGINAFGDKLMGISLNGSLRTHVNYHRQLTWKVPDSWSMSDAATVPLGYSLSYYGLFIKCNLHSEDTVLISYTGSSVEIAALYLALNSQCQILIGTKSPQLIKKIYNNFPDLQKQVINLLDEHCNEQIMSKTNGSGIDIIVNCGTEDIFTSCLESLNNGGAYVKINLDNEKVSTELLMDLLNRNCVLYNVTVEHFLKESSYVYDTIADAIYTYIKEDSLKPLPYKIITLEDIKSLKKVSRNKLVVKINDNISAPKATFAAVPKIYLNSDKSYIIFTDLELLELEVINWLVERGANKIVLNSRTKRNSESFSYYLQKWICKHCTVIQRDCDISFLSEAKNLVNLSTTLGPLGGIFNISTFSRQLDDEPNLQQCQFECLSIRNLDSVTRDIKSLDYFVIFTSTNSSTDSLNHFDASIWSILEKRKENNLPVLGIKWGYLGDENSEELHSCLETLEQFMLQDYPLVYSGYITSGTKPEVLAEEIVEKSILTILGVNGKEDIDFAETLAALGMDSLAGFELKNMLATYNKNLTIKELKQMSVDSVLKLVTT